MTDLNTTFAAIATAQGLGFLNALKSIQALNSRTNADWPILYLDDPKSRKIALNKQGAIPNVWEIFFIIVDKDDKKNGPAESQAIIDACRDELDEFIQRLRDYTDAHDRKVVQSMTDIKENELFQWTANVLSGVTATMTITFVNPTYTCI